jgi:hypothetical protein
MSPCNWCRAESRVTENEMDEHARRILATALHRYCEVPCDCEGFPSDLGPVRGGARGSRPAVHGTDDELHL